MTSCKTNIAHKVMGLMVTAKCDRNCPLCYTKPWRDKNPSFDLPLEKLEKFIKATVDSEYHFDMIFLSGGEPLLWMNIVQGCKTIRAARIASELRLLANTGGSPEKAARLMEVSPHIDSVDLKHYKTESNEMIVAAQRAAQRGVRVNHKYSITHRRPRTVMIAGRCRCPCACFWGDSVSICAQAPILVDQLGDDGRAPWRWPVERGYLDHFNWNKWLARRYCGSCNSNLNINHKEVVIEAAP